jgi:pSer/pThr/pTyr-binding forkhead associated (FHA) protein
MATLVITLPSGNEEIHELTEQKITIGRQPDNDIHISDASVSSYHGELTLKGADYHFKDLGSTNGTRIDGKTIEEADLTPGTHFRIGKIDIAYSPPPAGETQPMPENAGVAETPAEESYRPSDFANASPFKSKGNEKDAAGQGIMGFAIFSMIVFLGAVVTILTLKPPQ